MKIGKILEGHFASHEEEKKISPRKNAMKNETLPLI